MAEERTCRRAGSTGLSGLYWGATPVEGIFLHGALLNAHAWDAVLLPWDCSAVALDLPGHGQSEWYADGDYSPQRVAAHLATWVRATDLHDAGAVMVGHSMGAVIATHLTALLPSHVSRLVLIDADPTRRRSEEPPRRRMRSAGSFAELVDDAWRMRPDLTRERVALGVRRGAVQHADGTWRWRWDPKVRARPTPATDAAALRAFRALRCPVTVIRGLDSPVVDTAARQRMDDALPGQVTHLGVPGGAQSTF